MSSFSSMIGASKSASAQKGAAKEAAAAQVQAAQISTDAMLEMWGKAQQDFAPYLQGGYQGITQLTQQMPQYMQTVVAPLYQEYMGYNQAALPDPYGYQVNPVTGQIEQPRTPSFAASGVDGDYLNQQNYTIPSGVTAGQQTQNAFANVSRQPGQGGGFLSGGTQLAAAPSAPNATKFGTQAGVAGAWERQPMTRGNVPTPTNAVASQNAISIPTQQYTVPGAPTQRGMMIGGKWYNEEDITPAILGGDQWIANPALQPEAGPGQWIQTPIRTPGESGDVPTGQYNRVWQPDTSLPAQILNPNYTEKNIIERTDPNYQVNLPQTQNLFGYQPTQFQNAFAPNQSSAALPTQAQLEQGGVLAPVVPEFQRSLSDFEFDINDPYFQTRKAEKEAQVNAWLAKQGLAGSTAGQTYLQKEMDKFMAEEYDRQYGRARTERDYLTQTDVDRYNLLAQRGNTLYGRVQGQQEQIYNRAYGAANQLNQSNLNLLGQRYNLGQNVYGLGYGSALDLAKMGAGAAGSAGQSSMTTGQNIGQNALYAGNAQAQSALTSGMANAAMWQSLGQAPANAWSTWQYTQPQNWGNTTPSYYGGGGSGMNYFAMNGGPTYSYDAGNTISGPYGR